MICYMIDYLVLKLGWDTEKILDTPHFENKRRFQLYNAMDVADNARPISALPIMSDKVSKAVYGSYEKALKAINKLIGIIIESDELTEQDRLEMQQIMEGLVPGLKSVDEWLEKK